MRFFQGCFNRGIQVSIKFLFRFYLHLDWFLDGWSCLLYGLWHFIPTIIEFFELLWDVLTFSKCVVYFLLLVAFIITTWDWVLTDMLCRRFLSNLVLSFDYIVNILHKLLLCLLGWYPFVYFYRTYWPDWWAFCIWWRHMS